MLSHEKASVEKADRFIKFLQRLATLKSKVIKRLEDYPHVLWICKIPDNEYCYCKLKEESLENVFDNTLIEVKLPPEPKKPEIPSKLEDYVSLKDEPWLDVDKLSLLSSEKQEQIRGLYNGFIIEWKEYKEKHALWRQVYQIYQTLYKIYQENLKYGEDYELILSFGLLSWRTSVTEESPIKELIKRHILTLKVYLEFNPETKKFTIHSEESEANPNIETEMIPNEWLPYGIEALKKEILKEIEKDSSTITLNKSFQKFIHLLHPNGEYKNTLEPDLKVYPETPVIEYAPALIYRKRSVGPFYDKLSKILENVQKGEISSELKVFAEIESSSSEESFNNTERGDINRIALNEVYFPKPYNDEQCKIVNKIKSSNVVLVQGPPGTGKSHTIANLICHLLACGNRMLITSKSSRALNVLKHLVPESIRSYCVFVFGEGKEEKEELQRSVSEILRKLDEKDDLSHEIEILEEELKEIKNKEAEISNKLKKYIDSEFREIRIGKGFYKGQPSEIALKVAREASIYKWFKDKVSYNTDYQFSEINWIELINQIRYFSAEKRIKLQKNPLSLTDVPSTDEIKSLFQKEITLSKKLEEIKSKINNKFFEILPSEIFSISAIKEKLTTYLEKLKQIKLHLQMWQLTESVINKLFSENILALEEKISETSKILATMIIEAEHVDKKEFQIDVALPYYKILNDAEELKEYFSKGGKKRRLLFFTPKIIKEKKYIFQKILIDGNKCDTLEDLETLCKYLKAELNIYKILGWFSEASRPTGSITIQIQTLKEINKNYYQILELRKLKDECMKHLKYNNINWTAEEEIQAIINLFEYFELTQELNYIRDTIRSHIEFYNKFDKTSPIIQTFLDSLTNKNIELYEKACVQLGNFHKDRSLLNNLNNTLDKLKTVLPLLIKEILADPLNAQWDAVANHIPEAWEWAQAKNWLKEFLSLDSSSLNHQLNRIEEEKREIIARIVDLKSCQILKSRITKEDIKHMMAWKQNVSRMGKGKGKYVSHYRKEAQRHLNEVKNVIPAWVMPLHRVWDTIPCEKEIFDVIIVDEASQIGFEGIPLFYLAKKVVVVGDDKQISPEAVGIEKSHIFKLMEEFLFDFKFKDSFDIETSLFEHTELRYRYKTSRIALREHFRCMPEIIRFCNELSYQDTPLIPLRQYSSDRLNPLEKVYVTDAFCEGEGQYIKNEKEAQLIVEKICELCKKREYANKTMGVIVLQGFAQASLIENLLSKQLGPEEISKRKIICGNPYAFQGDERDIIFLSMVIAPNKGIGVKSSEDDRRKFNVAVSRARDQIWLFHSVQPSELSRECFRRRLIEYFSGCEPIKIGKLDLDELEKKAYYANRREEKLPEPFESWFEVDVALELARLGFHVIPQYKVDNYRIDLVVEGNNRRLAVECDGDPWHTLKNIDYDLNRQRILERCGWKFFRIRASEFYYRKQKVLEKLQLTLERLNILPRYYVPSPSAESKERITT